MMRTKGFTLVETLVTLSLVAIIGFIAAEFARNVIVFNTSSQDRLVAQLEGRRVLKTMVSELRTAIPSEFGSYPIESVATNTLVFFANVGNNETERVRFYLDPVARSIRRGVTPLSGNPPVYNTAQEELSTLITNIVNGTSTPLFEYFDSSYDGTSAPLGYPVDISRIRLVKINVLVDRDPNRSPDVKELTSQVSLRNLKDNL